MSASVNSARNTSIWETLGSYVNDNIVTTEVESFTGPYLYSDYACIETQNGEQVQTTTLNELSKKPVIGILAGITRVAFAIIHSAIHLVQALFTQEKGHLYHAAKGGCEIVRGLIDSIPILGRFIAANKYSPISGYATGNWTIMKIYNPAKPDLLDRVLSAMT